jgi:hypothetical protein
VSPNIVRNGFVMESEINIRYFFDNSLTLKECMQLQIKDEKSRKTKKKWATQCINAPLIALDSPIKKYYESAYHCSSILEQKGKKVTSRYCNCRTCITCNGIRTASYIAGYGEQVLKFSEPQFVTLTAPTVQCYDSDTLRHYIDAREFIWRKIYHNSKLNRKGIVKLIGLKAMEITARPDDHYHIHFHFIIDGFQNAVWLKTQWLNHYRNAGDFLQVIKPVVSKEGLLEVFKYGTKFFDKEKKIVNGKIITGYKTVEPERVDLIIRALAKKRLISTFGGIRRVKDENVNDIVEQTVIEDLQDIEYDIWQWVGNLDWFSIYTGEKFSDFVPTNEFRRVFIT